MKTKKIKVGDVLDVPVLEPENLGELKEMLGYNESHLLYLASRGLDQTRRTYLLKRRKQGDSKKKIKQLGMTYRYRGQRRQY